MDERPMEQRSKDPQPEPEPNPQPKSEPKRQVDPQHSIWSYTGWGTILFLAGFALIRALPYLNVLRKPLPKIPPIPKVEEVPADVADEAWKQAQLAIRPQLARV